MDFRKAKARQPEILRAVQKDAHYVKELAGEFSDVLRLTGARNWIKYNHLCELLAAISYHGFAAICNLQTLGEEYTGVIQVSRDYKHIPSRWLQLASIVLEFCGDQIYMKLMQKTERYIESNEELLPEAKEKLFRIIRILIAAPPYIKSLHKSLFYLMSDKYQISKRFTGINYVLVRHWLEPDYSLYGYKILSAITFMQVTLSLAIDAWLAWRDRLRKSMVPKYKRSTNISSKQCVLCLENCRDISVTPCGHIFCWLCILDWLDEHEECPICRESLQKSRVVTLQNYT